MCRPGVLVVLVVVMALCDACFALSVAKLRAVPRATRSVRLDALPAALPVVASAASAAVGLSGGSIIGGLLSGGLHAVSGPDHIAAVLPPSMGHPWLYGMRIGAAWGLGHGVSATGLGLAGIILKGQMSSRFAGLERLSSLADSAVGFSLLFIGALGIKESRAMTDEAMNGIGGSGGLKSGMDNRAIFSNGLLHGFSLDGAPSIAPALAMSNWRSAVWFLLAYCFGTMATMSITAAAVGESSLRLVQKSKNPKLPRRLCLGSSAFALLAGVYWIFKSFFL